MRDVGLFVSWHIFLFVCLLCVCVCVVRKHASLFGMALTGQ